MEPPLAHLVGHAVPDLALPLPDGQPMRLRAHVGQGPQVLFFFIRNGTPG
jgi:peroxiredoxin